MNQPLSLFSEEYTPHGNVAAEGILNQLGRPGLDLLTLLVRETVQNSRDARLSDEETVCFTIAGRTLTTTQLDFLRTMVLVTPPSSLKIHEVLPPASETDNIQVLVISDRGTSGLNGPIRANTPDDSSGSRNFANFFFNTGQSKGKQFSGGTYGYGKSILYRVSKVHTICAYTRCQVEGKLQSRFMAAALDPHEEEKQAGYRRYTGRHWWGRQSSADNIHEPIVGNEADEIAHALGLPPFEGNEQGTTYMLLCPALGLPSLERAMQDIAQALLWYAWPAMITQPNGISAMQFSVTYEGKDIPIPDPSTHPPLNGFVAAMRLLQENQQDAQDYMWQVTTLASQRPKQRLGKLTLLRFLREDRANPDQTQADDTPGTAFPITRTSQHIALMRNTGLIVKYLEGPNLPGSRFEYGGVFIAERAIDSAFAQAEPPTHDDWNPQTINDRQEKTYVNVALRDIKKAAVEFTTPLPVASMGGKVVPLGSFADKLASFMIGVKGSGAHIPDSIDRPPKQPNGKASPINIIPDNQSDDAGTKKNDIASNPPPIEVPRELFGPESGENEHSEGEESMPHGPAGTEESNSQKQSSSAPSGSHRQAKIYLQDEGYLALMENTPVLMTAFRVEHAMGSQATTIDVQASVVLDNGSEENEPPANQVQPEVLAWITPEGKERSGSETIRIPSSDNDIWRVAVSVPEDAMIRVNLTASGVF